MTECCANCRNACKLVKFDYSHGGCEHTEMEGYACMSLVSDGEIEWLVGLDPAAQACEAYEPKTSDDFTHN